MGRKITDPFEAALAFQRGEEAGFDYFFNEYRSALLFYAGKMMINENGGDELCKDMVEEVFIRLWENRTTFSHPRVIKDWLYTCVKNECLRYFQVNPRHRHNKEEYSYLFNIPEKEADDNLIRAEVIRELYICLDACLPAKCKKIVMMRYIQDKSVNDICAELGLRLNTVKNQLAIGIHKLRKKYEVDEVEIVNKRNRLIKRIYFSTTGSTMAGKMFGYTDSVIWSIRNGRLFPEITKNI